MVRRTLRFTSVCTDKRIVRGSDLARSVSFLDGSVPPGELPGGSVADIPEEALLRWVMSQHPTHREFANSFLDLPQDSVHAFSLRQPLLPPGHTRPGDIDWLIVPPTRPDLAVVAECKRVKVVATCGGPEQQRINKVESLGRGVLQANSLSERGFHRTFLVIMIVVDGRAATGNNVVFRGMNQDTFDRVYDFPFRDQLNDEVGVMYIEIVQPTIRHIDWMAQVGYCIDRPAKPRDQTASTTNRVREVVSHHVRNNEAAS